ncbi:MAG TPA: protein-L-isoaspartate(D-aspartate) O-methyltransferase [Variovorax sp.]
MDALEAVRDAYARSVVAAGGSRDPRLIDAFRSVAREQYLGPGPWTLISGGGRLPTDSTDPRVLYQDVLVALAAERGINNGQPSLHARCIAACAPRPGETVLHVGAGTGYYTAILARLVAPGGTVIAYEIESDLAARASANLAATAGVSVLAASATEGPLFSADIVYVCAGATGPPAAWLDALEPGGRLLFPLTPDIGWGIMLLVTRRPQGGYAATNVGGCGFIPCRGARSEREAEALAAALSGGRVDAIRSLHRDASPDPSAWCVGQGWWLSTAP